MIWRWTAIAASAVLGLAIAKPVAAVDFVVADDGQRAAPAAAPYSHGSGVRRPPARRGDVPRPSPRPVYPDPYVQHRPPVAFRAAAQQPIEVAQRNTLPAPIETRDPLGPSATENPSPLPAWTDDAASELGGPRDYWDAMGDPWGYDTHGQRGGDNCGGDCQGGGCPPMAFPTSGCWNSCDGASYFIDLWLAQGFTGNYDDPRNNFNLPMAFNDRSNEYQMNQLYLSLGRKIRECGDRWDIGARLDLLYGTDYFFTTALGLETRLDGSQRWNSGDGPRDGGRAGLYGLAMPQLYGEVYAPILSGLTFRLGHFYTTVGYESVMSPANFFYSHSHTFVYGEPRTHTGVLTYLPLTQALTGHFAYTRGWNTWEDPNGKPGYLAGLTWAVDPASTFAFSMHSGNEDIEGQNNRFVYSMVFTRQVTDRFRWVIQHDLGNESLAEIDRQGQRDDAKWYSIVNYFYGDITPRVTGGIRAEWFRDQDNARVLAIPFEEFVSGGNYVTLTGGLNVKIGRRWLLRPELRWDWSDVVPPNASGMFNDFTEDGQITGSFDLIFQL